MRGMAPPNTASLKRAEVQRHAAAAAGAVLAGPAVEGPGLGELALVLEAPPRVLHYVALPSARFARAGHAAVRGCWAGTLAPAVGGQRVGAGVEHGAQVRAGARSVC